MKYRKRPVVIDAYQLPAAGEDVPDSFEQWCDEAGFTEFESDRDEGMLISTLEGTMRADPGDWIIKGVAGEFYPCKPDIFAATYEPVSDDAPSAPQAEPKREPNPDEVICPACTHQFRAIPENVQAQLWALDDVQIGTLSTQGLFASMHPMDVAEAVRLVEWAHGIGGSDAE